MKEGTGAIKWKRPSCRTFAANAVRLRFHALAYNLGNFMRTLAMPKTAEPWSLTSLREKLAQSRCEGHQPRPLRHLPDGRRRGVATDVRRHPIVDRPAAGTARNRHEARGRRCVRDAGRGMARYGQSSAVHRSDSVNRPLRSPFACGEGDLSLPKPVEDAILGLKSPGIWRMSE